MDIERLKVLAGVSNTQQQTYKSLERELAERRLERMKNVMREDKPEKVTLEKLPYDLDALEPVLSKENVDYHYNTLSAGYVNRYNNQEGDPKFNYGGAKLHNLFWQQLKPSKQTSELDGPIAQTIKANFGDIDGLTEALIEQAKTIQGSGWVYMTATGTIKTTPNQSWQPDVMMPIDMWEHSFTDYIPDADAKSKYIKGVVSLINWDAINRRIEV
ncbi:MAG: hypothetical protein CBC05_00890 [Crocinitomicaceae bacterium TMED45]|nr:MAG: hypothetical protein CBC05_00890 [Crocinitomicaceae bacterium TMED45]|tara:strand:- start:1030 stop:1674 length:645 start_codon:yes stop_codon:yes gene_type:complete